MFHKEQTLCQDQVHKARLDQRLFLKPARLGRAGQQPLEGQHGRRAVQFRGKRLQRQAKHLQRPRPGRQERAEEPQERGPEQVRLGVVQPEFAHAAAPQRCWRGKPSKLLNGQRRVGEVQCKRRGRSKQERPEPAASC